MHYTIKSRRSVDISDLEQARKQAPFFDTEEYTQAWLDCERWMQRAGYSASKRKQMHANYRQEIIQRAHKHELVFIPGKGYFVREGL